MQVHVLLDGSLEAPARIFVKERSEDPMCSHSYPAVAGHNTLMFRVPLGTCRMQRLQQFSNKFSFTTAVVVSFHEMFVSELDRSYRITCDYSAVAPPPLSKAVTVGLGVNGLDENSVDDARLESSIQCSYRLFHGATEVGSAEVGVKQVRVGDRLEHRWECENLARNQFLFVHDCIVNPEFDLQRDPVVLDSHGCPIDAIGMGEVRYSPDGRSAFSEHTAYKFADYPNLLFKCSISVCRTDVAVVGCPPTVPVDCSKTRNPRSSGIVQQNSTRDIVLSESIRFGDLTEAVMDETRPTIHYKCLSPNLVVISAAVSLLLAMLLIAVVAHTGTSNQTVAAFFTNAHFYYSTPSLFGSVNTNNRNFVHTMNGGEISFEARGVFFYAVDRWWGFEAIVGAYDNENTCPFESDAQVEVDDSAPRVVASQWYFDDDSTTLPQRKCQWMFAPKAGYKLKIAFSVFVINATDESVRLYEDAHPVFNLGSAEELPSRVFYTEKNFKIEYERSARTSDPLSTRFLAVVSAFPLDVKSEEHCTANTTITLTDDLYLANYDVLKPYGGSQECNFYVNSVPGKEVQFSGSIIDIEDCCDSLTIEKPSATGNFLNPRNDDFEAVYSTVGTEMATIRWKSDGKYGRAGFQISAKVLDCKCKGEKVINLNEDYNGVSMKPSRSDYYCHGMDCQWTVSAPENSMIILELHVNLRGLHCDSNTYGDSLEISDGTTTYKPQCIQGTLAFYNKNLSINFKSSDKLITNGLANGMADIWATYDDLVSLRTKNTVRFINDPADFVVFTTDALEHRLSSVTFTLSKELSSKKLQLYLISTEYSQLSEDVLIMDGDLTHVASAIFSYGLLNNVTIARPITSTTGSITVVLTYEYTFRYSSVMLLKVYDDSRDCSDTDSVFNAPPDGDTFQMTYTARSQNSKLLVCPLTILSLPVFYSNALSLGIDDIQGTDKSVKVLPGTDHNATAFYEVSKSTFSLWDRISLHGDIFTILVPVETTLNFSISKTRISDNASIDYYGHRMGIFMMSNYPNGDSSKQGLTSRSLKVIDHGSADNTFKAKFEVFGSLSPSSSLHVLANKEVVLNATSDMKLQSSYDTGYASVVSFIYSGPEREKGLFVRYEVIPSSKRASILSISAVLVLVMTVGNLIV
ncbi:hypothetical protein QR680_004007 [Steinernema hermaphroditum]|uniref:ZP domain-containing protein n=1 Tax=Steinernema hermaphroditum TaxID=289476 RepID=A0AA39LT25_9BILA|nr:hypothetical protein QR680_004007 [Steinernema hermaphroditum]